MKLSEWIKYDDSFDAEIVRVKLSKSLHTVTVEVTSKDLPASSTVEELKKAFCDRFGKMRISFLVRREESEATTAADKDVDVSTPSKSETKEYTLESLRSTLMTRVPSMHAISGDDFRWDVNSGYHISVYNESLQHLILESQGYLQTKEELKAQGVEIHVDYIERDWEIPVEEPVSIVYQPPKKTVSTSRSMWDALSPEDPNYLSVGKFVEKDYARLLEINQLSLENGLTVIMGTVFGLEARMTKTGTTIVRFDLEDQMGNAIGCKYFSKGKEFDKIGPKLRDGLYLACKGKLSFDTYEHRDVFMVDAMQTQKEVISRDTSPEKRVELTVHTQMSNMEGLIDAKSLAKRLQHWGHKAVGITDKGSVQAYPLVFDACEKADIKPIFGLHAKMIKDDMRLLTNRFDLPVKPLIGTYTVFDLETTGFSKFNDCIIEIGAVRVEDGNVVGRFSEFVYPEMPIPARITELTSIDDTMVARAETIESILPKFLEFAADSILVAHNADFDIGFVAENARALRAKGIDAPFEPIYMDTMWIARSLHPEYSNHKLDTLTKHLGIRLANHHRACDDAEATSEIFLRLIAEWEEMGLDWSEINQTPSEFPMARRENFDTLVYVQKQEGVKRLYQLVSDANMKCYFHTPGYLQSALEAEKEGLLLGTGTIHSELFAALSNSYPKYEIVKLADQYDFFVVEPTSSWQEALHRELVADEMHFREITTKIVAIANQLKKPVFAVGMPYYLDRSEMTAKNVLVNYQRNIEFETEPIHYLKDTTQMLEDFAWMGKDAANELVIEATNRFADSIEDVRPIPKGTFTPHLEGAEEELRSMATNKAISLYGDPLPEYVQSRLDRELGSIIKNGYASLYVIAQKLVKKSNDDGYLVGSRGSVGSSFVATMADITEVNPLMPHYRCPSCKHSEFIEDDNYGSGIDLPDKDCPKCGTPMEKDGYDIPFEVFLGFHGDKEPDIDLNFASEYQLAIHKYTEDLFGMGKVFRAGTISGVQERTAYGFIRKYLEQPYIPESDQNMSEAKIKSLQRKMEGTKRTTGQHAGGLMIVPHDMSILDFSPIQFPADDQKSDIITTHFSYKNLSGRMLKLDELGHTAPSLLRSLQTLTGIDPMHIQMDDPATMQIFHSTDSLNVKEEYSNVGDGSLGIPEFGTSFVRGMLKDTNPTTFAELVRISGLSHGTNVWLNNAQTLIQQGTTDLTNSICTRDDIMIYLIRMGMDNLHSFKIMEAVRKGKGIPPDLEPLMREHGVPEWYIESCNKISYMFPKSHAVAYVLMSYRIAYFKVHYPAAFYATYFDQRLSDFSTKFLFQNLAQVQDTMRMMKAEDDGNVDNAKWTLLEVIEEMYARGLQFSKVDLYASDANHFTTPDENSVRPPLCAIDDVSEAYAKALVAERQSGEFLSVEELKRRTGATKNAIASLQTYGCFEELPETNQINFLSGLL